MSELIKKQFNVTRQKISSTLEGLSSELLDIVPEGFNNNIHWQVGHILVIGELFMFNGQNNFPAEYAQCFKSGTKPADWNADVPSVETILGLLDEQLNRINSLPEEAFTIELQQPFIGNKTTGELAAFGAFHEALHLGQIQTLKKLIEASQTTQVK